ncbi:MAG TPA: M20/M25/M40 family metallo-hydrolase [Solirubrobacter sp.]|nr:M20/M25/M40 family metallo-hydrolase [Solirubrobacter sp.]
MSLLLSAGAAANATAAEEPFQPSVTYDLSVTGAERAKIHAEVEALAGRVNEARAGDGTYDPLTLVGSMLDGSDYDSISRGGTAATAYPFPVSNTQANQFEYDRKVAKLAWVVKLARDLGFPVVVQRQPDKYVYAEIGDPDAPEMIMGLSHLDSPTASVTAAQLARWRDPFGNFGTPGAYHFPYVKDGWVYGAGIQDDSGPTLATLIAAKALMEAGLPMDRRIRIVMGIYEDGGPGTPSAANTARFQSIPYNANPSFYDNWAYKNLNREEMPIAAYTSDSRFPVIVGNSGSVTPSVSMSLSADSAKAFRLTDARAGVTLREGDPTLKDIVYGSTTQIASRAIFTLDVAAASSADRARFVSAITEAATAKGWLPAAPGTTPKVLTTITGDSLVLEINTDVPMEMPTPQYGKNAVVWGMFLLSRGLGELGITADDMQLKKAADGIADLFFRDGVEGEAYIGSYMGIPEHLLRNPANGTPNLTFALMGGINNENPAAFYNAGTGSLSMPVYVRSMHVTAADSSEAMAAVRAAFEAKGFTIGNLGQPIGAGLYVTHDNPLTALQFGSYKATIEHDPEKFPEPKALSDVVYPQGTTGGTLASNFRNKMTAFGAVIPGNERWWHTANERMKIDAAVQMTKMMADDMLEMARYTGPSGAKFMWADIPGLNPNRSDLDLLDATIGTFKDASAAVGQNQLGTEILLGATSFNIPMWNGRGNSAPTAAAFALGHAPGGVYLPLNDPEYLNSTYVAAMRLEFKVERPDEMSDAAWADFVAGGYRDVKFNILVGNAVVPLKAPAGHDADKYFATRIAANNPDVIYLSVNLAITDAPYHGVQPILANSKTDLYTVNPEYLASNPDPFPERGKIEQRGFFLFGDGRKNAEFSSPDAIYVSVPRRSVDVPGTVGGTVPATLSLTLGAPATFGPFTPGVGQDYFASTTATVTSSAGDATLTVADPSGTATGHLANGAFSLPQPLQASAGGPFAPVGGSSAPTTLKVWDAPTANESSTVNFKQTIAEQDALRTGTYAKTLTFTLSTTNP